MTFTHSEIGGHGIHVGARESRCGVQGQSCVAAGAIAIPSSARPMREREALGYGALQHQSRIDGGAGVGESGHEVPSRRGAPEVFERDGAPRYGGSRCAEHCFVRAELEACHHDPLTAADELSMCALSDAERVYVEAVSGLRTEANHELDLRARNGDERNVVVALVNGEGRQHGRGRRLRCDVADVDAARGHETIVLLAPPSRKSQAALVRFFQSEGMAVRYVLRMKILITGATGKVGGRLAKRLARRGDQVRALVRDPSRAGDLRETGIELAVGDLLAPESLVAGVRGVDAVVHCAAFFRGASPEEAHAVNDLGTQHLAHAARAAEVKRFVFTSTGLVYGSNGGRRAREDDPCRPTAAYPESKLAAERFLLALEGLDVRVLRLPFVYGDGDPHIAEAVGMMRGFPPTQRMSIGHHVDVAQAVGRLLDASTPTHRVYNVVDDEAPELAELFASVGEPPPDGSNAEFARVFDVLLDGTRIREDLGFVPEFRRLADAMARGA